jgi:hypothetical protein
LPIDDFDLVFGLLILLFLQILYILFKRLLVVNLALILFIEDFFQNNFFILLSFKLKDNLLLQLKQRIDKQVAVRGIFKNELPFLLRIYFRQDQVLPMD